MAAARQRKTAAPRPYATEDVGRSRHVVDAALSADGAFAVYQLSEREAGATPEDDRQVSSLWRVALAGGAPRRLTAKGRNAASPQISPDSRWVYFLSPREPAGSSMQIFRLPLDGGEAEEVASFDHGVSVFALSPDGAEIAFAALAEPPPAAAGAGHTRISRLGWRFDPLPRLVQDIPYAIHLVAAGGGKPKALTAHHGIVQALAWSPKGETIAAVFIGRGLDAAFAAMGELVVVDRKGTEKRLVEATIISAFAWSADGRKIAYLASPGRDVSRQSQLFVVDAAGGAPASRTAKLDLAVGGAIQTGSPAAMLRGRLLAMPDRGAMIAPIQKGGEIGLWEIGLEGEQSYRPIIGGERLCQPLARAGSVAIFAAQDFVTPSGLRALDLATGEERRLSDHNRDWRGRIAWPKVERLSVKSQGSVNVEGWVMTPALSAAPFRTLLFIHGGPHAGWGCGFNEDFLEMAGAGYAVAFANPRGSTGYGDAFSTAIVGRWGDPELADFTAFLDELVRLGIADPDRLGVTGVSGGGHLSGWLIGQTDRFKAAVPEQGVYNMFSMYGVSDAGVDLISLEMGGAPHEKPEAYWDRSPLAHAHKCRTPTLLIQGENDVRCPMEQAEQMFTVLKKNGCEAELLRLGGCNHGLHIWGPPPLRRFRMAAMRDWFDRHLPARG